MADLLPSVQRGPALIEAPNSMVGAGDYARLGAAWGGAFDSLRETVDGIALDYAKKKGEEDGYKSVQRDGNGNIVVQELPGAGLVGQAADAYRNTALAAQGARAQTSLGLQAQNLYTKLWEPKEKGGGGGDPQWFQQQWREVSIGAAQNGTAGDQLRLQQQADEIGAPYMRRAIEQRASLDSDANTKTLLGHIDLLTNDASQLARSAYNGPEFQKTLAEIQQSYDVLAADPRSGVTPELAKQGMTRLTSTLAAEATIGAVERAYDPAAGGSAKAALALADSFETDPQFKDLSPSDRKSYRALGYAYVRGQEQEKRAIVTTLSPEVERMVQSLNAGIDVPQSSLDGLISDLSAAGGYRQIQSIMAAKHQADTTRQLQSLTPEQLAARGARILGGDSLMQTESGGRPGVVNDFGYAGLYQFGAPRLADLGIYTPGAGENLKTWSSTGKDAPGKWGGTFSIPGFPEVKTLDDFRANPAAQQEAYRLHVARMDADIDKNGLGRFIGQTVGGVEITRDGIRNMMHLGGTQGAIRFLTSGGTDNPADANGTSLADYARMGARSTAGGGASTGSYVVDGAMSASGGEEPATGDGFDFLSFRKVARDMIGAQIPKMLQALDAFEVPDADQFRTLGNLIHLAGTPDDARKYTELAVRSKITEAAQELPADQFQAFVGSTVDEIRQGSNSELKALIPNMENTARSIVSQFKSDPHAAGQRLGIDLPSLRAPLPLDQADMMPAALLARFKDNQKLAAHAGSQPSLLTPAEETRFGNVMRTQTAAVVAGTLNSIAAMDRDSIKATLGSKEVSGAVVAMANSPDWGKASAAFSFMDQIDRKMPLDFNELFGEKAAAGLDEWKNKLSFVPPEEFQKERMAANDPAAAEARKTLSEQATKALAKSFAKPSDVVSLMDNRSWLNPAGYVSSVAPVSDGPLGSEGQLYADFSARFADAYVHNGGNESAAADFAAKQIAQKWAPSAANGGRIMANPPEKYFPQVDGSYDWIRAQLDADVAEHFGIKPGTSEVAKAVTPVAAELYSLTSGKDLAARMPPRNYGLVADQTTEAGAAAKKAPTYRIVVEADDGTWHLLEQTPGVPLRFRPDLDKAQAPVNAERQRRDADQRALARMGKPLSLEERDEASPYKLP